MKLSHQKFDIADFTSVVDVRDGLNPSLRKVFCSLKALSIDDKFKRSSSILKEIVGDEDKTFEFVYDLIVNTTQTHCDLPFVIGHGNFGFPPAYPDFSEMRLSKFGNVIVGRADLNNFDLPFTIPVPYTLVCGILGYCNGETKIPTHNLSDIVDAIIALIKNPDMETKDLLHFLKGPDLLIGGTIENSEELCDIYEKGFGNIKVIVTPQNFNMEFIGGVKDYCDWYGLKSRKLYKKEAYRIEIPYHAFMSDGEKCEVMSLKKILQKHLEYYRAYKSELSDSELREVLMSLKEGSSCRKTSVK